MREQQKIDTYIIDRFEGLMKKNCREKIDGSNFDLFRQTESHYIYMIKTVIREMKQRNLI